MDDISEIAEHIEHAGHAAHGAEHGGNPGEAHATPHGTRPSNSKYVGLTMALLGVLLALTSALVGGARTELIATMVEQTGTSMRYQAVVMKHRTLLAQLQQLHALLPSDPGAFAAVDKELDALDKTAAKTPTEPLLHALRLATTQILNTVTPTRTDVLRFVTLVRHYADERDITLKWAESYEDAIKAHSEASEHYEWAQLCAEFGVVLASISLLLGSRLAWGLSVVMAFASMSITAGSLTVARGALAHANHEIHEAERAYDGMKLDGSNSNGDEELLKDIERVEKAH